MLGESRQSLVTASALLSPLPPAVSYAHAAQGRIVASLSSDPLLLGELIAYAKMHVNKE